MERDTSAGATPDVEITPVTNWVIAVVVCAVVGVVIGAFCEVADGAGVAGGVAIVLLGWISLQLERLVGHVRQLCIAINSRSATLRG